MDKECYCLWQQIEVSIVYYEILAHTSRRRSMSLDFV